MHFCVPLYLKLYSLPMQPRRIALFIWLCIALLGGLCLLFPKKGIRIGEFELRWTTLAKVLDLDTHNAQCTDGEITAADNGQFATGIQDNPPEQTAETSADSLLSAGKEQGKNRENSTETQLRDTAAQQYRYAIDTRTYMGAFYTSLAETDKHSVRVVYYGDSQIEEDRMTATVRRQLQTKYGGGGVGLIPLHQTIPARTIHQVLTINGKVQSVRQGPKRQLVYGPKSMRRTDGRYGVMGQVALMNDSLIQGSERINLTVEPMSREKHTERYFNRLRVWSDGNIHIVSQRGDTLPASRTLVLPDSTTHYNLTLIGRGQVYGLSLETPTGVIVDNIPMRGCLGTVFTGISREQLTQFYRETDTRLVILQFGGNAIPFNEQPSTIRGIVSQLRKQVQYIRSCVPEASVLFVGPGDMVTTVDGVPQTYPLLPYMDKLLLQMAQEEQIGYYSLYQAMGGQNSMLQWQKRGWAGSDGVHFTRRGAEKAGEKLAEWLISGGQATTDVQSETQPADTAQLTVRQTAPEKGGAR